MLAMAMLWLAAGKGCHTYIPIKMASGVQDITCVFVEVAGSCEKNVNLRGLSQIVFPTVSVIMTLSPDPPP